MKHMDLLSDNPLKISAPSAPFQNCLVLLLDIFEGERFKQPKMLRSLLAWIWSQGLRVVQELSEIQKKGVLLLAGD